MERIELEVAIDYLLNYGNFQLQRKTVPLMAALHQRLAEDCYAPCHVPSFNRSAMDGYAVKASQTQGATQEHPIKLPVLTEIVAGQVPNLLFETEGAVRIMTGAMIPDGFDSVIRQEDTNYGEKEVEIYRAIKPNTNYSKIGEDIEKGQLLIQKGTRLTPIHLGILASIGIDAVEVVCPLKVGLISTGSELAPLGEPLVPGQIYDSNRYVLAARLQELQVEVVFMEQISDSIEDACDLISQTINQVDLLITTGGVSVGKKDIIHEVMRTLKAQRLFWRVNIRPGTPVLASLYRSKLILSLSGNPFAALTTFELLFRPLLGEQANDQRKVAILKDHFTKPSSQRRFVRGYYEDGHVFLPTKAHASSVLSSMLDCNCLIDIPAKSPSLKAGDQVEVVLL